MQQITVSVADERVAEFHRWFADWLEADRPATGEAESWETAVTTDPETAAPYEPLHWTGEERELGMWLWPKLSENAEALFGLFMDRPGERLNGDQAAEGAGIPGGGLGVAGVLGWPARWCHQRGYQTPLEYSPEGYWMEPEVAELLKGVRDSF
jgi:hypothetical protein